MPRIVVIGGGFAGLALAKELKNKKVQVVLLDKNNFHAFQPLLYQVATSALEPDMPPLPPKIGVFPSMKISSATSFRKFPTKKLAPLHKVTVHPRLPSIFAKERNVFRPSGSIRSNPP